MLPVLWLKYVRKRLRKQKDARKLNPSSPPLQEPPIKSKTQALRKAENGPVLLGVPGGLSGLAVG